MPFIRLILAIVIGVALGGFVNMGVILSSSFFVAPPPGADMTTPEGIQAAHALLEPKHYLFPFLAHALGTLIGAFAAVKIEKEHKFAAALVVGSLFFVGGIQAARMIPAPTWFVAADLVLAYFPCALLGYWLATKKTN